MQDALCPGCGQPRDESFDSDYADAYKATLRRCHACAAQGRAVETGRKAQDDFHGMYAGVTRDHHDH